jgi:hypothetical protein
MQSILIHPASTEQLKTVKAVLKALKVQFEEQTDAIAYFGESDPLVSGQSGR